MKHGWIALLVIDPMDKGQGEFSVLSDIGAWVMVQSLQSRIEQAVEQCGEPGREGVVVLETHGVRRVAGVFHEGVCQRLVRLIGSECRLIARSVEN
ncbi:hypothetical protein D3C77_181140 [compost metagenome]